MAAVRRRPEPSRPLSSAEIAAESEPSIAMITGDGSVGTGFLVRPGIIATNAHVIEDEFMTTLRVRFPSAEKAQQGPLLAELLYEDTHRDLAFLQVKSTLPPLRIAAVLQVPEGRGRHRDRQPRCGRPADPGECHQPGAHEHQDDSLEGQKYYQLTIAVNPGNSGGPVFNSFGSVIGVVTRKSTVQEALAFSIPIEELNLALGRSTASRQTPSNGSNRGTGWSWPSKSSAVWVPSTVSSSPAGGKNEKPDSDDPRGGFFYAPGPQNEGRLLLRLKAEVEQVRQDRCVGRNSRKVGRFPTTWKNSKLCSPSRNPGRISRRSFPTSGPRIAG